MPWSSAWISWQPVRRLVVYMMCHCRVVVNDEFWSRWVGATMTWGMTSTRRCRSNSYISRRKCLRNCWKPRRNEDSLRVENRNQGPPRIKTGHLMYVWPCIIYENDERYQLDATIAIYYHKYLYMFRASICPFQKYRFMLLHMVFSTRCYSCGPKEPACNFVHCV